MVLEHANNSDEGADLLRNLQPKRKTHRCFTNEELKSLFGAVTPEWRLLMILGYYTGLRFGDCCTFKMDYIDWNNNRIDIEPEKTKRYKKRVIIPLHSTLTKALKSYTNALSQVVTSFLTLQTAI